MILRKIRKEFCSKCGSQLVYKGMEIPGYSELFGNLDKFDKETRKRVMRPFVECPNLRSRFFGFLGDNGHDTYFLDDILVD